MLSRFKASCSMRGEHPEQWRNPPRFIRNHVCYRYEQSPQPVLARSGRPLEEVVAAMKEAAASAQLSLDADLNCKRCLKPHLRPYGKEKTAPAADITVLDELPAPTGPLPLSYTGGLHCTPHIKHIDGTHRCCWCGFEPKTLAQIQLRIEPFKGILCVDCCNRMDFGCGDCNHQGMIVAFIAKIQRKDGPLKACLCDGPKSCQAGGGALTRRAGLVTSQSSSTHHGGPHNVWSILPQRLHGTPLSQPVLISALTRPSACQSGS